MKPCSKCGKVKAYSEFHRSSRYTDGHYSSCKLCRKVQAAQFYEVNKERINERNKKYNSSHKERVKERSLKYYHENKQRYARNRLNWQRLNKDKVRARCKRYYLEHLEYNRKRVRDWAKLNPLKKRLTNKNKQDLITKATPIWADTVAILKFYDDCPEGFHVDHIIPLQGETVTGLHVLENLQYLPAKDNISKSNKFIDYPDINKLTCNLQRK